MKIKICGLNPTRDVQLCIDLKVNYLGFIFYEKSPRNVNLPDIKILSKYKRNRSSFVAVTVNPTDEFIKKNLLGNFDYIQLHGSETRERITEIKNFGFKIIKAIKVKEKKDIDKHQEFNNADIILFDTPGMEKSIEFPKNLIAKIPKGEKYALAGSISVNNNSPVAVCVKLKSCVDVPTNVEFPTDNCSDVKLKLVSNVDPFINTAEEDATEDESRVELLTNIPTPVDVCVADEDIVLVPTSVPAAADDETAKPVIDADSSSTLLTLLIGFSDKALKPSIIN